MAKERDTNKLGNRCRNEGHHAEGSEETNGVFVLHG
jgi:hypothetical protein